MREHNLTKISKSLFVDPNYKTAFEQSGLTSVDAVFSFTAGENLTKTHLPCYRTRLKFELPWVPVTVFLKRYDNPPIRVQLKNWLCARARKSCSFLDHDAVSRLSALGINTPKTILLGEQWGRFFEKRSFIATEKIPNAQSLEKKLPPYCTAEPVGENLRLKRAFIDRLAGFIKRFHQAGFCHRDLYFAHIFYSQTGQFCLIDLARVFKPACLRQKFRIKDLAQLYYSAPARYFSKTDRLRFYLALACRRKLTAIDRIVIRLVKNKAKRMAKHDRKHGRAAPFEF